MAQSLIAYGIVALALAWVVWSMFVPRTLKQKVRRLGRGDAAKTAAAASHEDGPGSTPPPD